MPDQKGTGKHPHKSSEERFPHTKESGKESEKRQKRQDRSEERARGAGAGGSSDLKEREYRDEQGNIHHHTRTYEEQHKGRTEKE